MIITEWGRVQGHAMVVTGLVSGQYRVVNPDGRTVVTFDEEDNATADPGARIVLLATAGVEAKLGRYIWYW